jgi:hypothetical protein
MAKRQSSEMSHGLTAAENARQRYKKEADSARYKPGNEPKRAARFATADGLRETIRQAYLRKLGH